MQYTAFDKNQNTEESEISIWVNDKSKYSRLPFLRYWQTKETIDISKISIYPVWNKCRWIYLEYQHKYIIRKVNKSEFEIMKDPWFEWHTKCCKWAPREQSLSHTYLVLSNQAACKHRYTHTKHVYSFILTGFAMKGEMNGVSGYNSALVRLYWAGDNLG